MKLTKSIAILAFSLLSANVAFAKEPPYKVDNVSIYNLDGKDTNIPYWGEKNLMIFYVDPDRAGQNQKFTEDLEKSGRAKGDNLVGFGILNLKDAPFVPNKLARSMAEKRTEHNGAIILSDENRTLATDWSLGDCNNKFVTIMINRQGELVYLKKGEFTPEEEQEFLQLIDKMK